MKKMILMFLSLVGIYVLTQILIFYLGRSYKLNYTIKVDETKFEINEQYTRSNTYYIEIKTENNIFSYQMFLNSNDRKIIKDIRYYKNDNIECILPIFKKNNIIFDITCNINGNMVYYHNIKEKNDELKKFAQSLNDIYNEDKFIDTSDNKEKNGIYTIYTDNLIKNHFLALTNYQGIITLNKKLENINVFSADQNTTKPIRTFTNNYYIIADHDSTYDFQKFYIVDIKTNKLKELKDYYNISLDSYIQGVINDKVYLFDLDNKVQYEIDIKNMNINKIGDIKKGIKYYEDGIWSIVQVNDAIKNKLIFKTAGRSILDDGVIIDTIINKKMKYQYIYKKTNSGYSLYKNNPQNPDIKNYLFEIKDLDSIIYIDDYIYFKEGNGIYYYSEKTGKRKVIESDEILINDRIIYTVIK